MLKNNDDVIKRSSVFVVILFNELHLSIACPLVKLIDSRRTDSLLIPLTQSTQVLLASQPLNNSFNNLTTTKHFSTSSLLMTTNCILYCDRVAYPISPYTCERCKKSCCKECFLNWMLERRNCPHCRNPVVLSSSMMSTLDAMRRLRIQVRIEDTHQQETVASTSDSERFQDFLSLDSPQMLAQSQTSVANMPQNIQEFNRNVFENRPQPIRRRQPQPTIRRRQPQQTNFNPLFETLEIIERLQLLQDMITTYPGVSHNTGITQDQITAINVLINSIENLL